jgi:HSP20 family molecular chaperone IbpA
LIVTSEGEFRPEELNVKVEGRMLIVKGDRQIKAGNATESKQFNRELTLPEFVDANTIQSYLSDDGVLIMEAPVLLDRLHNESGSSALASSTPHRLVDTTFTGGRQPSTNFGYSSNQPGSYSTTSSTSSFRQEGPGQRETSHYRRNSPLRDQYSSTASSASTLIGGSHNNQAPASFASFTSRPEYSTNDRNDGVKQATYKFDLHQFAPEDIAIQVNDTMLKVTALRQEREGRGSSQREFRREIGKVVSNLLTFFYKQNFIE